MENRKVGFLITGIAIIMAIMVFLFNNLIKKNIGLTCSHGPSCGMYSNLSVQTWISISLTLLILIIGLFLIFSKKEVKIITKKEKKRRINLEGLDKTEKEIVGLLQKEGAIFQASLMEKLEIGKVGITRILDKLEAKQIIERKRRGMNNIVVLKN